MKATAILGSILRCGVVVGNDDSCLEPKTNITDYVIDFAQITEGKRKFIDPIKDYNINKFSYLALSLAEKFNQDKIRLSRYVGNDEIAAGNEFNKCIHSLYLINPDKVVFSLTSSKSISFRIYKDSYEIHLESFYTKDDEDDNIEIVYSIYKDNTIIKKDYGSSEECFNDIVKSIIISLPTSEDGTLRYGYETETV